MPHSWFQVLQTIANSLLAGLPPSIVCPSPITSPHCSQKHSKLKLGSCHPSAENPAELSIWTRTGPSPDPAHPCSSFRQLPRAHCSLRSSPLVPQLWRHQNAWGQWGACWGPPRAPDSIGLRRTGERALLTCSQEVLMLLVSGSRLRIAALATGLHFVSCRHKGVSHLRTCTCYSFSPSVPLPPSSPLAASFSY